MASTVLMSHQQLLSDMDRALGIEIKAKEKGGNSRSHTAVDGQPRGEQNGFFLYQYSLNEPWSPDDDTPINIKELGNRSIKPIIVTSTGTMITIATSEPLPPEALKQITLLDDSIELTRRLREALQNIKESDAKLGLKVFGAQSYCGVVVSLIRLNEITFYPRFKQDLEAAKRRIVIVSPYLANRANELQSILLEKRKEGVTITVVIDPLERFEKSPEIEDMLKKEGIEVLEYPKAHMKHAIIDEEIIYEGSLNILSHKDRHESMIRKKSLKTAKMVWEELFKALEKEAREQTELSRKAEQQGIDIQVRKRELPVFSKCLCGQNIVPKLKNGEAFPFYGCENYSKEQQHSHRIELEESHLMDIVRLRNAKCKCNSPMRVKRSREDVWLECAAAVSCGYWQRITFSQ